MRPDCVKTAVGLTPLLVAVTAPPALTVTRHCTLATAVATADRRTCCLPRLTQLPGDSASRIPLASSSSPGIRLVLLHDLASACAHCPEHRAHSCCVYTEAGVYHLARPAVTWIPPLQMQPCRQAHDTPYPSKGAMLFRPSKSGTQPLPGDKPCHMICKGHASFRRAAARAVSAM